MKHTTRARPPAVLDLKRKLIHMAASHSFVAAVLLSIVTSSGAAYSQGIAPLEAGRQSAGVDSGASIMSRIGKVPPEIVERYAGFGQVVTDHDLTDDQERMFFAALDVLTPLHLAILEKHLRSISFVMGMPSNAQTARVLPGGPEPAFDLIFNARVLGETLSEFATRKERQLFEAGDSPLSVSVVAGSMDAVAFVLAHEATHVVDMVLGLTPVTAPGASIQEAQQTPFAEGVWESSITPASLYRTALLDSIPLRTGGAPLDIDKARALYEDLERTPFVSVYASLIVLEDIAELVAWRQMTEKYGQPYRIEIRDDAEVIYSYEPMKSSLVRSRLDELRRFDSPEK